MVTNAIANLKSNMHIKDLIEQLHALAVENPTAIVINGAETDDECNSEPLPVSSIEYIAATNTIVIDR